MALFSDYLWFEHYTRTIFRYRFDERINQYIEGVLESAASRTVECVKGTPLWSAQRGCRIGVELPGKKRIWKDDTSGCGSPYQCKPFTVERMKPEPEKAREGRVNPKGIPYLYLATHEDTAMSEVRPWHEARISLARFQLTEDVRLVDCSQVHLKDDADMEAWNWRNVGEAFSQPVNATDDVSDYAPTQILAEALRQHFYDGIIYDSGLNRDGKNVALFDLSHADVKERFLYTCDIASFFFNHNIEGPTDESDELGAESG